MLDASEDDVKNHPGVQLKTNVFKNIWLSAEGSYSIEGLCSVWFFSSALEIDSLLFKCYGLLA